MPAYPEYKISVTHLDKECTKLGWGVFKLREGTGLYYMLLNSFEDEEKAKENLAQLLQLSQEEKPL